MTRIILDHSAVAKLQRVTGAVELCDSAGIVLGKFVPQPDLSQWNPNTMRVTKEELDRRSASDEPRYTTAEVLRKLNELE